MRIYLEAYGCALNRGEAKEMAEEARAEGHVLVLSPAGADLILLDTCAVIQGTENRMLDRLKALGRCGKTVVVAGCLAAVRPERVLDACPWAILLPPGRMSSFAALISCIRPMPGGGADRLPGAGAPLAGKEEARVLVGSRPEVVEEVPIADGCRGRCTYCIARVARGELRSREPGDIVRRVRQLVERGCREIRLTAQDSGLYGRDIGTDLCALLEKACDVEGDFRIRVGMMNPDSLMPVFERLMGIYDRPKLFRFLHIPVQSGDDAVLEKMGRSYGAGDFLETVERYRRRFQFGLLSTDIIIGFPDEGEMEFERTLELMERARPDIINIKAFSPRPGTTAAGSPGRAEAKSVNARIKRLNELRRRISMANNIRLVGRTEEALVTELARGGVLARTADYYPVLLREKLSPGTFHRIRITEARAGFLIGERT